MKKIFNFALYDFANSSFTTIIITFIFATYFAKQIAPNPVLGQSYWGWAIGNTGLLVAIIGPIIVNIFTIPFFWIMNGVGYFTTVYAVNKGYKKENIHIFNGI